MTFLSAFIVIKKSMGVIGNDMFKNGSAGA